MYELKKALGKKIEKQVKKNFNQEVKFLKDIVKVDSITPGEGAKRNLKVETEIAKIIRGRLRDFGLRSRYLRSRSGRPNLLATWGPSRARKSLLFAGHMDTARPSLNIEGDPLAPVVRNGKLYGLGVLDMKASLAAYVFAYKALKDLGLKLDGKMKMAFFVDGKGDKPSKVGLQYLVNKGLRAKAAVLGKPGTDKVAIAHRGGYQFVLRTKGESVNTGRKAWEKGKKGKNAIHQMYRVMKALGTFDLPFKPAKAFPGRQPVFSFPTKISGGSAVDVVPEICEAWGDVRLMPGNTDVQVRLWIEDKLRGLSNLDWELEDLMFVPSMEIEKSEKIVQTLLEQSDGILKDAPKVEGCGPWNDAWMLTSKDVPCIAGFGPDGGEEDGNEWVDLDSLERITAIYARAVVDFLGEKKTI